MSVTLGGSPGNSSSLGMSSIAVLFGTMCARTLALDHLLFVRVGLGYVLRHHENPRWVSGCPPLARLATTGRWGTPALRAASARQLCAPPRHALPSPCSSSNIWRIPMSRHVARAQGGVSRGLGLRCRLRSCFMHQGVQRMALDHT